MVSVGVLSGLVWIGYRCRACYLPVLTVIESTAWALVLAFLLAKVAYWIFFPASFWVDPIGSVLASGGLVWYGGLVGALISLPWLFTKQGLPLWLTLDTLVPPTLLGLACGRVGCLLAGCCYGGVTRVPWAIHYPHTHPTAGFGVHPSPVYESLGAVVLIILVLTAERHPAYRPGWLTGGLLVGYGLLRFGLEYLRGDRLVWVPGLGLSASQVVSLVMIALGLTTVWFLYQNDLRHGQHVGQ
jgi:phosphatidylglycerol---prolipoprotein diacylglyceryl transferase